MKMISAFGVFLATLGGAAFIAMNPVEVAAQAGSGNNVFAGQRQVNELVSMVLPPYKWLHD